MHAFDRSLGYVARVLKVSRARDPYCCPARSPPLARLTAPLKGSSCGGLHGRRRDGIGSRRAAGLGVCSAARAVPFYLRIFFFLSDQESSDRGEGEDKGGQVGDLHEGETTGQARTLASLAIDLRCSLSTRRTSRPAKSRTSLSRLSITKSAHL